MKLGELKAGQAGKILAVGGMGALRRRLMDMGLTPGTHVLVRKVAPLGDPIELNLRGYELTLRREDAQNIVISVLQQQEGRHSRRPHGRRKCRARLFGGRA